MTDPAEVVAPGPFEGPEKLLEIWFAACPQDIEGYDPSTQRNLGLRSVPLDIWKDMLDIVKCQILSVVNGKEIDAYLLRYVAVKTDYMCVSL